MANSFSLGGMQFSARFREAAPIMKAEGHKRSYCHTHTKHESKVEFYHVRLLSRCCWWTVPKPPRMPVINWPCNRIKIGQQHVVFPNRHSWLFWGGIELGGVVLPEGVHFGQHRGGGAIIEIFLFTCALPGYFLLKKEIGDEVRNIFGTHQLIYLFFMYLDAEKAQETHLQQWKKLAAEDISNSLLLTDFDRTGCSFRHTSSEISLIHWPELQFVIASVSVRKSHSSGLLLSSGAIVTWDWWSQGLVPLLAAQITSLNSSSRGLSICS